MKYIIHHFNQILDDIKSKEAIKERSAIVEYFRNCVHGQQTISNKTLTPAYCHSPIIYSAPGTNLPDNHPKDSRWERYNDPLDQTFFVVITSKNGSSSHFIQRTRLSLATLT